MGVCDGLENGERLGVYVDDSALAIGRIDMHPHRVIGLAWDFVDEEL